MIDKDHLENVRVRFVDKVKVSAFTIGLKLFEGVVFSYSYITMCFLLHVSLVSMTI